jgi:hypothetical protein
MIEIIYDILTEDQKAIFNLYKSNINSFAYSLNDFLRQNDNNGRFQREIEILDQIISLTSNQDRIILHRATNDHLVSPFIQDNIYRNPEYLSTATDLESVQGHFTNPVNPVYLKFFCNPKIPMANLESNPLFGGHENEILLGRNNNFKILSDRLTVDQNEIEIIMDRFNARDVNSLRIIELEI